jgi:hypothetical protein
LFRETIEFTLKFVRGNMSRIGPTRAVETSSSFDDRSSEEMTVPNRTRAAEVDEAL